MPLSMENKEKVGRAEGRDFVVYEVGFQIIPTVAEDDLGVRVTAIRDIIESKGGKMISDEYPKHIELAYPMLKITSNKRSTYHDAYFGWMKFEADPIGAEEIAEKLMKDDYVIRSILVKTVRENTMVPKKVLMAKPREEGKPDEKAVEKPVMTEEELDKTIEDLVVV